MRSCLEMAPPPLSFHTQLGPGVFAKVAGEDRVEAEAAVVAAWAETLAPGTWAEQRGLHRPSIFLEG